MARRKINFSVVIPVYNKADTIERAVRSVLAQTCSDYEIICVDDGSTDGSAQLLDRLDGVFVIHQRNQGVSAARNAGARAARGDFVALLDGDDYWEPHHLEDLARAIERHPDVSFFGTGYEREQGKWVYYTIPWPCSRVLNVYDAYRYGERVHTSSVAILRELWMAVGGFNTRYSFYEDYEFFFRLGLKTRLCIVPRSSVRYTADSGGRLSKKRIAITCETWPHLLLIDELAGKGLATKEMLLFAGILLSRINRVDVNSFYPHLEPKKVFRPFYRVMCHLYLWRRSVR